MENFMAFKKKQNYFIQFIGFENIFSLIVEWAF
jgi:hypothetical protein